MTKILRVAIEEEPNYLDWKKGVQDTLFFYQRTCPSYITTFWTAMNNLLWNSKKAFWIVIPRILPQRNIGAISFSSILNTKDIPPCQSNKPDVGDDEIEELLDNCWWQINCDAVWNLNWYLMPINTWLKVNDLQC